jgi:hypothetical protein
MLSNTPEPFCSCMVSGANLPGDQCCPGFKASVVVEQCVIRFLQYVPLEKVSPSRMSSSALTRPLRRVTNTYRRCLHEVQLVSGPTMTLYLRIADFVSARGGGEQ